MARAPLKGLGWERDLPDFRDYSLSSPKVEEVLQQSKPLSAARSIGLPTSVDLRAWCSPIEDQEDLGSCTANAGVALFEYYQRRAYGIHLDGSRLFLYKATRDLLEWPGDQGAYLRSTMKAMVLFGVPPEHYWPYQVGRFDDSPPTFCYAYAQSYKAQQYFRLDPAGTPPAEVLSAAKGLIAATLPFMFGFTVYSSIPGTGAGHGNIPFPNVNDRVEGGHAIVAVGYDDDHRIGNDKGAFLIRNSWGTEWGEDGYGYLPYSYVLRGLAADFWSLISADFVDSEIFN